MTRNQGQKHKALIVFVTGPHNVVIMANDVIIHKALIIAYVIINMYVRSSTIFALSKSTSSVAETDASAIETAGFPHSMSIKKYK